MLHLEQLVGSCALDATIRALCFIARYKPDGDLSSVRTEQLELVCRWQGEPGALIEAWHAAGFLDPDKRWHDWDEINSQHGSAHKREQDRKRQQRKRHADAAKVEETEDVTQARADVTRDSVTSQRDSVTVTRDLSLYISSSSERGGAGEKTTAPPATKIFDPEAPEPLGPYGEVMPKEPQEILDYPHRGKPLRERWRERVPQFSAKRIEEELEAAMVYRSQLQGPRRRAWFWPDGFVTRIDDWLRRVAERERPARPNAPPADYDPNEPARRAMQRTRELQLAIAERDREQAQGDADA